MNTGYILNEDRSQQRGPTYINWQSRPIDWNDLLIGRVHRHVELIALHVDGIFERKVV
jgi:hypothetical protein